MKMKTIFFLLLVAVGFASCTQKESYKVVRQQVLDEHDKIMMDTERAFKNKMNLDRLGLKLDSLKSIYLEIDTVIERERINTLRNKLIQVDDEMNTWMHQFDAELGEKSNEEALAYFEAEKQKVNSLDTLYKDVLKQSDDYLKRFNK